MPYVDKLHTNSEYAPSRTNLVSYNKNSYQLELLIEQTYSDLLDKELEFYAKFGYNSVDEFYNGIRSILKDLTADINILNNLSSHNLRQSLQKFGASLSQRLQGQDITLSMKLDTSNFEQEKKRIEQALDAINGNNGTISYHFTDTHINVGLTWNTARAKEIINITQHKKYKTSGKSGTSSKALFKYIRENSGEMIKLYEGKNTTNPTIEFPLHSSPFNYSVEEIRKSSNQQLLQIRIEMLNFLYNDLNIKNGSREFVDAVKTVLDQTISSNVFSKNIEFLAGGTDKWVSNVVGAMGELQAAVFFNYIAKKCPNKNLSDEITKIIGNSTANAYKQMPHSDLQILDAFGIQVKNYSHSNFGSYDRTIDVNLHPMEIASLMSDIQLASYVINSYFNQSLEGFSPDEWQNFFEQNAIELLNLDLPTKVSIPQKVSFYLIGGHLIPGSEIIRRGFMHTNEKEMIKVSRTNLSIGREGMSDIEYLMGEPPEFVKWWRGSEYTSWNPTPDNSLTAWDKYVSIRTTFTFKSFWETGEFKLF